MLIQFVELRLIFINTRTWLTRVLDHYSDLDKHRMDLTGFLPYLETSNRGSEISIQDFETYLRVLESSQKFD